MMMGALTISDGAGMSLGVMTPVSASDSPRSPSPVVMAETEQGQQMLQQLLATQDEERIRTYQQQRQRQQFPLLQLWQRQQLQQRPGLEECLMYLTKVERLQGHMEGRRFVEVKNEIEAESGVNGLDSLVLRVSAALIQSEHSEETIVFYGLPLSITSAKTPATGRPWAREQDHWVIANDTSLFVAFRQDAAYFQVICDGVVKDGFGATVVALKALFGLA